MYWSIFPAQGIIWEARTGESLLSHSCDLHSPCGAGNCPGQGQSPPALAEGWKPRTYLLYFLAIKSNQIQNFPLGNKGQSQMKICFWNCEVWTDLFAPAPAAQGISQPSPADPLHGHNAWDSTAEDMPPWSSPFSWDTSNQLRSTLGRDAKKAFWLFKANF